MSHNRSLLTFFTLSILIFSGVSPSLAAVSEEDNWQFNLAPFYLWGVNIDGDLSAGAGPSGVSEPVDVPFGDIFDSLEGVFIVHFEAMHKSNWGLLVDVNYLDIGNDLTNNKGVTIDVDFTATVAEVAGLYRIHRNTHVLDTIFGARGYRMDPGLSLRNGPNLGSKSEEWVDPFVGGRWTWHFAENWYMVTRGDIGGFGVSSDFAWQALGLIEWQAFKYMSFLAGYRALGVDYEDGSGRDYFKFDATFHGPMLGLNFNW